MSNGKRLVILSLAALAALAVALIWGLPRFKEDIERLGEPERKIQQELAEIRKQLPSESPSTSDAKRIRELEQEVERLKKLVPPSPPYSQLDDAFAKLTKGITEEEALETLKSCGVDWKPTQILSYTIDLDDGNEKTRQVLCKDMHWGAQYPSVVPDTPDATNYPNQHDYLLELHLHFADGKLYDADRMDWYKTRWNMLWRPPKNEEKK